MPKEKSKKIPSEFKIVRLNAKEIKLIEDIHQRYEFWSGADLEEVILRENMEKLFELIRMTGKDHAGHKQRDYSDLLVLFDKKIRHFGDKCKTTKKSFFKPKRDVKNDRKKIADHEEKIRIQKDIENMMEKY